MRALPFNSEFEAVLITGRSIAYIIENHGITDTLNGIWNSLVNNGLLVFGVFDARQIFDNLSGFEQNIEHGNKKIRRISQLKKNLSTGWTWDWSAKYIIEQDNEVSEFEDITTLRAFTRDEIELFLKLEGFEIDEIIDEVKAFTIIARKK